MGTVGETASQVRALEVTERIMTSCSMLGAAFIFTTFALRPEFHKPVNRLIVFASCGNVLANIATMISTAGNYAGADSALCQTQGFFIQMFMPADALWSTAMAINVYLTFFRRYDRAQLRAQEWKYFLLCYGVPFVMAFTYLFLKIGEPQTKVYGPAVVWCWISRRWAILRLATFYGPVWACLLLSWTIYIWTGVEIYRRNRQLLRQRQYQDEDRVALENPFTANLAMKTIQVEVSSEERRAEWAPVTGMPATDSDSSVSDQRIQAYSVTIESRSHQQNHHYRLGLLTKQTTLDHLDLDAARSESNRAVLDYARVAFCFFLAMLFTWVPASINRVYGVIHPDSFNFALEWFTAFGLPLQGFWNAIIYIVTSLPACAKLYVDMRSYFMTSRRPRRPQPYGKGSVSTELQSLP